MIAKLAIRVDFLNEITMKQALVYIQSRSLKFLAAHELKKTNGVRHFHIYSEMEHTVKIESFKQSIRRGLKKIGYEKSAFCVQTLKDYNKYMLYITKDLDILEEYTKNMDLVEIETILKNTKKINKDKKLPVYKKLYNRWIELDNKPTPKPDLYSFIANTMIFEFDTFVRRAQIVEYAVYIQIKQSNGKKTQSIINEAYGIMDWNDYNNKKKDKLYKEYLENKCYEDSDNDSE